MLVMDGDGRRFRFDESDDARHQEGVHVVGLYLLCPTCTDAGGRGIVLANDIDDVTVDDVVIEGFDIGISVARAAPCAKDDPECDGKNTRITIRGNTILNSRSFGIVGSGDNLAASRTTSSPTTVAPRHRPQSGDRRVPVARFRRCASSAIG